MNAFETTLGWEGRKFKNRGLIKVKDKEERGRNKKCSVEKEKR